MSTTPTAPLLTRRAGLLAVVALGPAALLAACSSDDGVAPPASAASTSSGADAATVSTEAARDESALIAAYDAALASLGDTDSEVRRLLTDIRAQHAAHRDALGGADDAEAEIPAGASVSTVIADLIERERRASRARIRASIDADAALARTLTFVAASEAAHVPALAEVRT